MPGLQIVDDEGRPTRLGSDRARSSTPRATPADKPLDAPTTKMEVQRAMTVVYNLVHKVLHDEVRFTASDFSEEADGLIELLNQHGMLRIALRIIAPLAMFGAIYEKVEGTVARWQARAQEAKARKEQQKESPNAVPIVTVDPNGLGTPSVASRPFGR